jgi:hypothetical protein
MNNVQEKKSVRSTDKLHVDEKKSNAKGTDKGEVVNDNNKKY